MNDAIPEHHAIGSDHSRDRERGGDLHGGNPGFFQLGGDRSAAARARSSGRRQDDRVDSEIFDLCGDLAPHTARI